MDGIDYNEDLNQYDLSQEKEQEFMVYIEDYEDENFWDELTSKLATRDAFSNIGPTKFEKLDTIERMKRIFDEEKKYINEFEDRGIQRLRIVK